MDIKLHKQATTTPEILADTQIAPAGMSKKYHTRQLGVSVSSTQRWRHRDDVLNRPKTRHNLLPTLTSEQEEIVIAARALLRLGLDDLLVVARESLNLNLSRSALQRMLKRRDVPTLAQLARQDAEQNEKPKHRPFMDYEPGYVHIDIKHLSQRLDGDQKRYLYIAIDRATRWVYLEVRSSQSTKEARVFMRCVEERAPFTIQAVLTDNGKSFINYFTVGGDRKPRGHHLFGQECQSHGIEHRLIKPRSAQTNEMVKHFNGRISDVLQILRNNSREDLEQTLERYYWLYNHHIPQKSLHHRTPVEVMKEWQAERSELFTRAVIN
ncbi:MULTISPECIES: DDE-type integrase/transposase/recombinase [unclassified Cobetia]|uniref:DDE-type integrase/transposase/recombinase n=1 Tax=unclassified Cobetia TaxID=2609414 RepID=UPI0020975220|nr:MULTISPECIES: DDE-type integrase/transposase/recombinase [unclassified Cobetia]MCO7230941.1 DDE-type integrase/transposase/recombinase [Cobetia sp. Dlab-2-AX]MCO7234652.1 DDE-type integrase/transposase/recombinase [Cobetia sp. Dlab-2-U]